MKLKNKTALVTGAGSGIGAAIAKRFVEDGAKVCIVGRRKEYLEKVAGELPPGMVKPCQGDISKTEDIKMMVDAAIGFGGGVDVLVNCAGVNYPGGVTNIELEDWKKIFDVNLNGPFLLMRSVIPHMIKAGGGSIINISSIGGLRCLSDRVGYCTSKAALIMLTQQAARDYGKDNVRCNVVCPGFVFTPMTEGHFGEFGEVDKSQFRAVPMGRGALPGEIGGICSYLASDDSSYMTGSVLVIDGGTTIVDPFEIGLNG
ncbi:MAG: SDR family oxidoreductase [Bacillota bacterium]|nr:SDR family oxidoreductase [Bacillota bacterium]